MASPQAPQDTHLLVVGDGPVRAALEAQAQRLGLAGRVTFTGVVHRGQVPAHVAAFDVALQPAVTPYASPLKLMEYLVLGKAVVAPATPNLQEVLTDNVNALMFEPAHPGALEGALTRLCTDTALRQRLAQGAADTIDRLELTWIGNARRVTALVKAGA
jgi:glycosyltransferase involved in cell wall biosynthesis